ncbi:MAG: hypothetical protein V4623_02215 [Pseudomonadota bacterium]
MAVRRCWAFSQLECLAAPQKWADLRMFAVIETERTSNGKTSHARRRYIGSIAPEASTLDNVVRAHWLRLPVFNGRQRKRSNDAEATLPKERQAL